MQRLPMRKTRHEFYELPGQDTVLVIDLGFQLEVEAMQAVLADVKNHSDGAGQIQAVFLVISVDHPTPSLRARAAFIAFIHGLLYHAQSLYFVFSGARRGSLFELIKMGVIRLQQVLLTLWLPENHLRFHSLAEAVTTVFATNPDSLLPLLAQLETDGMLLA